MHLRDVLTNVDKRVLQKTMDILYCLASVNDKRCKSRSDERIKRP